MPEALQKEDPHLKKAAADMKQALDELKALGSSPSATDKEILAASLRLNVARNALSQTRNPTAGAPDPLVVGIGREHGRSGRSWRSGPTAGRSR